MTYSHISTCIVTYFNLYAHRYIKTHKHKCINTWTHTYKNTFVYLHINTKTHLDMGQLEDFRASLKRKDSTVSSEGEIPVKSIAKEKQEKMKRRTLGVSGELHLELKALSVWRIKSHPKASPGITDTIQEMMRVYYKKYPEAKEFVDKFCE